MKSSVLLLVAALLIGLTLQAQKPGISYKNTSVVVQNEDIETLYNGFNYDYYEMLHFKYKRKAKKGMVWAFTGVGMFGVATLLASNAESDELLAIAGGIYIFSFFSFNIGVPSWAANAAKAEANKEAMEIIKSNKYKGPKEVVFGPTARGIGMVLKL